MRMLVVDPETESSVSDMPNNFCWLCIWRLRNSKELQSILEELDALHDRRVLMQMYQLATAEKHSFWYINLLNDKESMFYKNFDQRMIVD